MKPETIECGGYNATEKRSVDIDGFWWEPANRLTNPPDEYLLKWFWVGIPYEVVKYRDREIVAFLSGLNGRWTYFDVLRTDGGMFSRFAFEDSDDAIHFRLAWG